MKKFLLGVGAATLLFEAAITMIWIADGWGEVAEEVDRRMRATKWRSGLRDKYRNMVAENERWDGMLEGIRNNPDLRPTTLNEIRSRSGLPPF